MAETIRLCTWNIHLGLQLPTILNAIRTEPDFARIDLLALQEASVHDDRDDAQTIARALGEDYDACQVTAHFLGKFPQANAVIWNRTRIHMSRHDTVILPRIRDVRTSRAERAFLCVLPEQQRISIVAEGVWGEQSLRLYVAHLDVLGIAHKRQQFERILIDARARSPAAISIVAGDLNTFRIYSRPSWSRLTEAAEKEGFTDLTSELLYTHHTLPRIRFRQKLDAVFVRSVPPVQYRSWGLDIPGSDHIPVFAEMTVR